MTRHELFKDEAGYSLVEVMASIIILTIAIIPMVGMFDTGLRSASLGANYDSARALANQQVENAQGLPYPTVRDSFPAGTGAPTGASGITSPARTQGDFTYTVKKTFMAPGASSLNPSATDSQMMEISVTVTWGGGKSYTTTGLVSGAGS